MPHAATELYRFCVNGVSRSRKWPRGLTLAILAPFVERFAGGLESGHPNTEMTLSHPQQWLRRISMPPRMRKVARDGGEHGCSLVLICKLDLPYRGETRIIERKAIDQIAPRSEKPATKIRFT